MINTELFYNLLKENQVDFFTGVPDSLLKDFCAYVMDNTEESNNIIAANEGNALAMASGYHLATGKFALTYMQNSGIGNIVNPLLSLNDPLVYNIPSLLLIGWRGEPGKKDEPQHKKQGLVTVELLDTMGVKYEVLSEEDTADSAKEKLEKAINHMKTTNEPFALVVRKGTFEAYKLQKKIQTSFEMNREKAIEVILSAMGNDEVIVSTTGMASRELFELREARGEGHERDFLTVGSMGHSSQIALGIALAKPERKVYCLDGDGATLMHMGGLAIIGNQKVNNFKHIIINNGAHDSVGGQPTIAFNIDLQGIAKSCGYKNVFIATTSEELKQAITQLNVSEGPALLEVKVNGGARKDLGRPTTTPVENKTGLMNFLKDK